MHFPRWPKLSSKSWSHDQIFSGSVRSYCWCPHQPPRPYSYNGLRVIIMCSSHVLYVSFLCLIGRIIHHCSWSAGGSLRVKNFMACIVPYWWSGKKYFHLICDFSLMKFNLSYTVILQHDSSFCCCCTGFRGGSCWASPSGNKQRKPGKGRFTQLGSIKPSPQLMQYVSSNVIWLTP